MLTLKSLIDSIPYDSLQAQYKESTDEDILMMEFSNISPQSATTPISDPQLNRRNNGQLDNGEEETTATGLFTKLFQKVFDRIGQIKECEVAMTTKVLFDFSRVYKHEEDNLSIFSDKPEYTTSRTYGFDKTPKRKLKVTKLKHVFKRALVDLKQKGRIDTGDSNINILLKFFLDENTQKITLLVDNFLTMARLLKSKNPPKLDVLESMDSDENCSIANEDKDKLISLKLQSIDEVIKRSERIGKKRDLLRKKKSKKSQIFDVKDRTFDNNSQLKRKRDIEVDQSRQKADKFFSRPSSFKQRNQLRRRNPSIFSTNEDESEDMNLQKYVFSKLRNSKGKTLNADDQPYVKKRLGNRVVLQKHRKSSTFAKKSELVSQISLDSETSPISLSLEKSEKNIQPILEDNS